MGTKNNPGKFDCYVAALPDEPMFVLLARDVIAPEVVRTWASDYKVKKEQLNGGKRLTVEQYAKYCEAMDCADAMGKWSGDYRNQEKVKVSKLKDIKTDAL